jgi:hypothetical protein
MTNFKEKVQAELEQKGSRTSTCSPDLADALRAAVRSRMLASGLTFAAVAAEVGFDASAFGKYIKGTRPRIRSGGTRASGLTLGTAERVAAWLDGDDDAHQSNEITSTAVDDGRFDSVVVGESSFVGGLL